MSWHLQTIAALYECSSFIFNETFQIYFIMLKDILKHIFTLFFLFLEYWYQT